MYQPLLLIVLVGFLISCTVGCVSPPASQVRAEVIQPQQFAASTDHLFALRVQSPGEPLRQEVERYAGQALEGTLQLVDNPEPPRFVDVTFLYDEFWSAESGWEPDVGGNVFASNYGSGIGLSLDFSRKQPERQPVMVLSLRGEDDRRLWHGTAELGHEDIDRTHPEAMARTAIDLLVKRLRQDLGLPAADSPAP